MLVGDGPLRPTLERLAGEVGADVEFTGFWPAAEVREWLGKAAVVAVPSVTAADGDSEGLPTVILEAQAMGTPVVATRHAGNAEGVVEGRTALLVEERDVPGLAAAPFGTSSNSRGGRECFGAAGRAFVERISTSRGRRRASSDSTTGRASARRQRYPRRRRRAGPEVDRRLGAQRHHLGAGRPGRRQRPAADLRAAAPLGLRGRPVKYSHRALRADDEHPDLLQFMIDVCAGRGPQLWARYRRHPQWLFPPVGNLTTRKGLGRLGRAWTKFISEFPTLYRASRRQAPLVKCIRSNLMLGWLTRHGGARVVLIVRHPGAVIESELRGQWQADRVLEVYRNDDTLHELTQGRYRRLLARSSSPSRRWRRAGWSRTNSRSSTRRPTGHGRALRAAEVLARRRMAAPVPGLEPGERTQRGCARQAIAAKRNEAPSVPRAPQGHRGGCVG
ncbi:MAG: glycosyltransferase [Proteobacteria bacterium]|nr:glycosyltransferase [Pseudomonadota bacterium]